MSFDLLLLSITVVILIHAALRFVREVTDTEIRSKQALLRLAPHAAWLILSIALVWSWPEALDRFVWPRRSLFLVVMILVFPFYLAESASRNSSLRPAVLVYGKILVTLAILTAGYLSARYLIFIRPRIEGLDFYYYVCVARDIAAGFHDLNYGYFPGVFIFWQIPFELGLSDLTSLQWWYMCLIVANAFAVSAVVLRMVRSIPAAAFAGCWYLYLCCRFQGFLGDTEPLATLPVLVGLLVWGGQSLTGRSGFKRAVVLGTCLGFALLAKQPGGLLSIGMVPVFILYWMTEGLHVNNLRSFVAIPICCIAVLLIGILLQGYGFTPLVRGIRIVGKYASEGDFWTTIHDFSSFVDRIFSYAALIAVLTFLSSFILPRFRDLRKQPSFHVFAFTVIAGLATLLQLSKRPFLHYLLLTVPMFVIATVLAFFMIVHYIPETWRRSAPAYVVVSVLAIGSMAQLSLKKGGIYLWPIDGMVVSCNTLEAWRNDQAFVQDLTSLPKYINRGEDIYILPPSSNEIHYFLGTRSLSDWSNYGWDKPKPLSDVLKSKTLDGVITKGCPYPCNLFEFSTASEILTQYEFKPAVRLNTMVLWRREGYVPRKTVQIEAHPLR